MFPIPAAAEPLVQALAGVFTEPTFQRFILLMGGLIVTMGRRTVSRALVLIEPGSDGHWCNYHRIYSQARFSMWKLGMALTGEVIKLLPKDKPIILVADDTVDKKEGDCVWGKGAHRDAKRSSRKHTRIKFGHKWLVICVLVQLPAMSRPWALPILCGLCRTEKVARKIRQRPKTASQITRQMMVHLLRWLPDRTFILLGDSKAVSHEVACFAHRHRDRLMAISRIRADANLYGEPRRRSYSATRPARKGKKLPAPSEQVRALPKQRQSVAWYGSRRRQVTYVHEQALWYGKHDNQTIPIRWICVLGSAKRNLQDAYFYCTDPTQSAQRIIELYTLRWNIEVTFEEARGLLGLETTRHWCRRSVLRVAPILFGLFTAVALMWNQLPQRQRVCQSQTPCYRKRDLTFSDALYAVRRVLWEQGLLRHHDKNRRLNGLPPSLLQLILWHLSAAG